MRLWNADSLLERGEDDGIELSELPELVDAGELSERDAEALAERQFEHDELAIITADTLQLFLRDVRRHPLLSAAQEVTLATG